jgi:hypothetical protein
MVMHIKYLYKYAIFIVCMDMLTTYLFITHTSLPEINPGAAWILSNIGFVGLLVVSLSLVVLTNKYANKALWLFVVVNTPCVLNNIYNILNWHIHGWI